MSFAFCHLIRALKSPSDHAPRAKKYRSEHQTLFPPFREGLGTRLDLNLPMQTFQMILSARAACVCMWGTLSTSCLCVHVGDSQHELPVCACGGLSARAACVCMWGTLSTSCLCVHVGDSQHELPVCACGGLSARAACVCMWGTLSTSCLCVHVGGRGRGVPDRDDQI